MTTKTAATTEGADIAGPFDMATAPAYVGESPRGLRAAVAAGLITYYTVGQGQTNRHVRFTKSMLDQYIESRTVRAKAPSTEATATPVRRTAPKAKTKPPAKFDAGAAVDQAIGARAIKEWKPATR